MLKDSLLNMTTELYAGFTNILLDKGQNMWHMGHAIGSQTFRESVNVHESKDVSKEAVYGKTDQKVLGKTLFQSRICQEKL